MARTKRPDPRTLPAYTLAEAAQYLGVPASTVRWWSVGRGTYPSLIEAASVEGGTVLLSFFNLVELHLLAVIRREHEVRMPKVRAAIDYLRRKLKITQHPLLSHRMQTNGVDLFVECLGDLINISQDGQQAMRALFEAALLRIERDTSGLPRKLYPFTRSNVDDAPRMVEINPRRAGGRPVLVGTGLATEIVAERYKAGESIEELAQDYGRKAEEIEEAIRCELATAA